MTASLNLILTIVPTLLFLLIVIGSSIFGFIRGFRKSSILAIQALVAFIISIIVFSIIVNNKNADRNFVSFVNSIIGENGLQRKLNVSESNNTLKEILIEYIPKQMSFGDGLAIILRDNGQYLAQLVNLVYRLIFAVICCFLYFFLVFFFYIIYVIAYPERRHAKKKEDKYNSFDSDKKYNKHRILGLAIGFGRGLVSSLMLLAFFGSFLYIVAGTGNNKYDSSNTVDFGDSKYSTYYDLYQEFGSYGTTGIYKVLNNLKSKNNLPYYLHLMDIIYKGNIKDEERGINSSFNFVDELGAYSDFTRKSFDLLIKYGGDDIRDAILNPNDVDMVTVLSNTFAKEGFQEEFDVIIDKFDAKVYFINFGISLIDSIIANIDSLEINGLNSEAKDLLCLLFQKDYLSPYIPEEKEILDSHSTNYETRPYIKASSILTKEDAISLVKATVSILAMGYDKEDTQGSILNMSDKIVPALSNLSMLNDRKNQGFNDVMARLYEYTDNRYIQSALSESDDTEEPLTFNTLNYLVGDINEETIDWCGELKYLLDSSLDAVALYKNVYDKDKEVIMMFADVFHSTNPKRDENILHFDNLKNALADSKILAKVLSSSAMYKKIEDSLKSTFKDVYILRNIQYANTYTSSGELISYGEIYNLLNGVEQAFKHDGIKAVIENYEVLTSEETDVSAVLDYLKDVAIVINAKDENDMSAIDYIFNSDLLTSILSAAIISNKELSEDLTLYIPDEILYKVDGETVNIINNLELKELFVRIVDLVDVVGPFLDENSEYYNDINFVIQHDSLIGLLDSIIIEGTLSSLLIDALTTEEAREYVYIPNALGTNVDNWVSHENDGETKKIIRGIKESGLDFNALIDEETNEDDLLREIKKLDESGIRKVLKSDVLSYSLSGFIQNNEIADIKIIVPANNKTTLIDDVINYVVIEDSMVDLLLSIKEILPEDSNDNNQMIRNIFIYKEIVNNSQILNASVVNYLVNEENDVRDLIVVNDYLKSYSTIEVLNSDYTDNIWNDELLKALKGLDEVLEASIDPTIDFNDSDALEDRTLINIKKLNDDSITTNDKSRLDVCYESEVLENTLTEKMKENEDIVVPDDSLFGEAYTLNDVQYYNIAKIETSKMVLAVNKMNIDLKTVDLTNIVVRHQDINYIADSKIIRATMSKNLIESDSIIVPLDDETINNGYISYSEMYKLLDYTMSRKIYFFDVEHDDDPINIVDIKVNQDLIPLNILNDLLDSSILHASIIFKLSAYTNIDFTYTLLKEASRVELENNFKESSWYINNEVSKLVNAMASLTGSGDSVLNTLRMSSVYLNTGDSVVLADSTIIRYTIYNKIKDELVIPNDYIEEEIDEGVVQTTIISKTELISIIDKLIEFKNSFFTVEDNKINISTISINQDSLSISTLQGLIECNTFEATMIVKVSATSNSSIVIPSEYVLEATEENIRENYTTTLWHTYHELSNLFNSLELITNDNTKSINNIDTSSIKSRLFDIDIAELYNSIIINYSISKALYDTLASENRVAVTNYAMDYVVLGSQTLSELVYSENHVDYLIKALKALGITDVDNINTVNYSTLLVGSTINFTTVYDSIIAIDILTINLETIISNQPDLEDHPLAWTNDLFGNVSQFYKEIEVENLVAFLNDHNITDVDNFAIDDLTISKELAEEINTSYILRSTTSAKLTDSDLVIPASDYSNDEELITESGLEDLFDSVAKGLAGSNLRISSIESNDVVPSAITDVDDLLNSDIMRATITHNVDSTSVLYIFNDLEYCELTVDYLNNQIAILTAKELKAFITVIKDQDSFDIEIDYQSATISELEEITDSILLAYMITHQIGSRYDDEYTISSYTITNTESKYYGQTVELVLQESTNYKFPNKEIHEVIDLRTLAISNESLISQINTTAFVEYRRSLLP